MGGHHDGMLHRRLRRFNRNAAEGGEPRSWFAERQVRLGHAAKARALSRGSKQTF